MRRCVTPTRLSTPFRSTPDEKLAQADRVAASYEVALAAGSVHEALSRGVPCFLALFADGRARGRHSAVDYYRAFIQAMRLDARPRTFDTLESLIDDYIYGSAIVVGYFLTYVYGPSGPTSSRRALVSARTSASRCSSPTSCGTSAKISAAAASICRRMLLRAHGVTRLDVRDATQQPASTA